MHSNEKGTNIRKDNHVVIVCEIIHTMDGIIAVVGSNSKKMDKYYSSQVTITLEKGPTCLAIPTNTSVHNIYYITSIVSRCIFNLFDNTSEAENKSLNSVLERISDRRKGPVFACATKFVTKCNQECTKILRLLQNYTKLYQNNRQNRANISFYSDESEGELEANDAVEMPPIRIDSNGNKNVKNIDSTSNITVTRPYQPSYFLHALLEQVDPIKLLHCREYLDHTSSAATAFVKYAHSLALKIDELQWKLLHILNEIDKSNTWKSIEEAGSTPINLYSTLQLIDSNGRVLMTKINKTKLNYNKKNKRNDESASEDSEDEEDHVIPDDSDDDEEYKIGRVNRDNKVSKRSQMSINFYSSSGNKQNKRLRSRNQVIDDWLEGEGGDDAFADLEDFIE